MEKRLEWIDVFRGLNMILMVLGHTTSPFGSSIYLFHVAAFFVLSGYATDLERGSTIAYIRKKVFALLVPFFAFNILFIAFRAGLHAAGVETRFYSDRFDHATVLQALRSLFVELMPRVDLAGATWFLVVLFLTSVGARLLFDTLRHLALQTWLALPVAAVLFLYAYQLAHRGGSLPYQLDLACVALLYFVCGQFARRWRVLEQINPWYAVPACVLTLFLFGHVVFGGVNWPTRAFGRPLFNLATAFAGTYLLYGAAVLLTSWKVTRDVFAHVGTSTLSILGLHFLAFRLLFLVQVWLHVVTGDQVRQLVPTPANAHWFVLTVGSVLACLGGNVLLRKSAIAGFLFLGARDPVWAPRLAALVFRDDPTTGAATADSRRFAEAAPCAAANGARESAVPPSPPARAWIPVLAPLGAVAATLVAHAWTVSSRNGFLMDDYTFIAASKFQTFAEMWKLLPSECYSDRPIGFMFAKALFETFGMNYQACHAVLLAIHLANVLLVYRLVRALVKIQGATGAYTVPFLTALIFGTWSRSTLCVQWVASNMDLLGALFSLLTFNLYFDNREAPQYARFQTPLMVGSFFLALRTKEITIVVPAIILLYELVRTCHGAGNWRQALRQAAITRDAVVLGAIMVGYGLFIFTMASKGFTARSDNPYFYSLTPSVVLANLAKYMVLFADFQNPSLVFTRLHAAGMMVVVATGLLAAFALYRAIRRVELRLAGCMLACAVALAPVLPMKNMQHMLYLYLPSVFLALLMAVVADHAIRHLGRNRMLQAGALCALAVGILALAVSPIARSMREWWMSTSMRDQVAIKDLQHILHPGMQGPIHVANAGAGYNVFSPYGPGTINRILLDDPEVETFVDGRPIDRSRPFISLSYDRASGHVRLLEQGDAPGAGGP